MTQESEFKKEQDKALRYNAGKLLMGAVSPYAEKELSKILTAGAKKYGRSNWLKGFAWSTVIDCLKRHVSAFEHGEDYDSETRELHLAHAMCNIMFLLHYYHNYPQGDDRAHWFRNPLKRVYLDIDGVVAAFEEHFLEYLDLPKIHANDWNDPIFRDNYAKISKDEKFWETLPTLIDPLDITYPLTGYCTSRSIDRAVTEKWLSANRFPTGELITLGFNDSKVEALKGKCDVFIDDSIKNFMELQANGILCYLKTRPHNEKYDVGHWRVNTIKEFFDKVREMN